MGDRVLFISYYFPPVGGAGVQRSCTFVRHLPAYGFEPVVVSGPGERHGQWEPEDQSLLAKLPAGLPVCRPTSSPPPEPVAAVRRARLLGRSRPRFRWWREALLETGLRAAERHRPRLIYVSLSPYEGLAPALELGRRLQVPVIADLRDPWALDEMNAYVTKLHRVQELRRMGQLLRRANRVLMNTPEALHAVRAAFPDLTADRVHVLTNGYDADDFAGHAPRTPDGRFRIVHSGTLHTRRALAHRRRRSLRRVLAGELWPTNFLGRTHYYLLRALERIQAEDPERASRIDVQLVGYLSAADRDLAARSPLAARVDLIGEIDHPRTIEALVAADLLFLPLHGLPRGKRARIVPLKTYEYLASGRPILAAVPEGDARDYLEAADAGQAVAPDDVEAMAAAIIGFMDRAPAPVRPLAPAVTRFEARERTRQLADHFRAVLGAS